MTNARDRLIVALDVDSSERIEFLADGLSDDVRFYKVGLELFASVGAPAVELLLERKKGVFLDLKLHDIPKTVERAASIIARLGASMTTVHSLGGPDVVAAAREGLESATSSSGSRTLLLAVTLLTSHREEDLKGIFPGGWSMEDKVVELAVMAAGAGADGVVCSPWEVKAVKTACPSVLAVTPGVRVAEVKGDDQRRTATPERAIADGADYLVVGRPISKAPDPREAAIKVLDMMSRGFERR